VALAQYLWERRNCVWLFEHMSFLVECVGEERIVSNGEMGACSPETDFRPYIPCNSQNINHRGHTGHH
jgi:hypothetical protein